jgi:hypothetical protein
MSFGQELGKVAKSVEGYADAALAYGAPKQKTDIGIGGFRLLARVADSTQYACQVPTTALEDGSLVTDHIILQPLSLSITGSVADVYLAPPPEDIVSVLTSKAGIITSFLPARTAAETQQINALALEARDAVRRVGDLIDAGQDIASMFGSQDKGPAAKSLREQFVDFIEACWRGKQVIRIAMPYREHADMVISSCLISRDNVSEALAFTLTAQQVAYVETRYDDISKYWKKPAPAAKKQVEKKADKGPQDVLQFSDPDNPPAELKSGAYVTLEQLKGQSTPGNIFAP